MKKLFSLLVISSFLTITSKNIEAKEEPHSIELGASFANIQLKYLNNQLLDNKAIFGRISSGFILFIRENNGFSNIAFANGIDLEVGLNDYFHKTSNKKGLEENFYFKYFGGLSMATSEKNVLYPYAGLGIGMESTYKGIGYSLGIDAITTLQSTSKTYLAGGFFLRPELNLKFVF